MLKLTGILATVALAICLTACGSSTKSTSGVTHIVVDPPYQRLMARTLGQWPQAFAPVYDDGAWTVYEVTIPGGGRRSG